jgi:FlgD Ig-like domain/Right handed beta helix region
MYSDDDFCWYGATTRAYFPAVLEDREMRRLRFSALALLFLTFARAAAAAVIVVPNDFPTVQAAFNAAASGDSIFIRAGTYNESLTLAGKDLYVRGEHGAVVLTTAGTARILDLGSGVTSSTVLDQLIFQSGRAEKGGALYLHDGAAVSVVTCRFLGNGASNAVGNSYGGAIAIDPGSTARLDSCSFARNAAGSNDPGVGGAVSVATKAHFAAVRCVFSRNRAVGGAYGGVGGAIGASNAADVAIEDCVFIDNWAELGGAISSEANLRIEGSRFEFNSAVHAGGAVYAAGDYRIESNVFSQNDAVAAPALELYGTGELRNNTVAFNGNGFPTGGVVVGGGVIVDRNLIASNAGLGLRCVGLGATITCNDVWANAGGNYGGSCGDLTGIDGNISADPIFCGLDLTLSESSPCAPSGSCGLIGALGVACPPLSVPSPAVGRIVQLQPVRPNPASAPLQFAFELARPASVRLEVFDLLGRRVATVEHRDLDAGLHDVTWDGRSARGARVGPGVYVALLRAGDERDAQRFVLAR